MNPYYPDIDEDTTPHKTNGEYLIPKVSARVQARDERRQAARDKQYTTFCRMIGVVLLIVVALTIAGLVQTAM
jgi:hypothetical protein